MKLADNLIIPREKLTKYLLVFQPENDKSQFLALAGYTTIWILKRKKKTPIVL